MLCSPCALELKKLLAESDVFLLSLFHQCVALPRTTTAFMPFSFEIVPLKPAGSLIKLPFFD